MESKQVQLYLDREKMIEASPVTSAECVILSDGNDLQKVLDNDLTTPTVVHEETSFKVGQGDIDVSGSIVDGEVGRMVIKGQTYQNILPEPSLRNSMTNGKTMQKLNEGYDSVNTVDGVCKSAILSGQTLVNLATKNTQIKSSWNTPAETVTISDSDITISLNDNTQSINVLCELVYLLKPNTKYIIIGNVSTKTENHASNYLASYVIQWYKDKVYKGEAKLVNNLRNQVFTTGEDFNNIEVMCYGRGFIGSVTFDYPIILEYQDGMENWDIPHFNGMQSVKMPVLKTTGKNLFDGRLEKGFIDGNTGIPTPNEAFVRSANFIKVQPNMAYVLSEKNASSNFRVYEYDGNFKYIDQLNTNSFTTSSNASYIKFRTYPKNSGDDVSSLDFKITLETGNTVTPYEPHKTNILTCNEEVTLRGISDVKDTLDGNTGELTQRIGEYVLDGSDDEKWITNSANYGENTAVFYIANLFEQSSTVIMDKFIPYIGQNFWASATNDSENHLSNKADLAIRISKTRLSSIDVSGFRQWLSQNPVTIQHTLMSESIKTVDLSSSGNWEKIVLDGSSDELWRFREKWREDGTLCFSIPMPEDMKHNGMNQMIGIMSDKFKPGFMKENSIFTGYLNERVICLCFNPTVVSSDLDSVRAWLSQNPVTVWYQTTNHQDSTQVKQPIFFKDGHIQLSSGADNSLIPTLDYEAKTSNSYVMDLMKTNTRYTMKAKSASGTFTIDGTSYGAGTNGTFTTPTSMTNKLLVMSDTAHEEVMILEGDVTDKTIPYFKGIKSAFEGEDKIEVLSSNCANLFHPKDIVNDNYWELDVTGRAKIFLSAPRRNAVNIIQRDSNGIELARVNEVKDQIEILPNAKTLRLVGGCFRPTDPWYELITQNLIVADAKSENNTKEIDYKSNNTKIPLLSPLRSLQNGVCDELIIDRMKKKATLIQRVGKVVLNGSENWSQSQIRDKHYVVMLGRCSEVGIPEKYPSTLLCSHFINQQPYAYDREGINIHVNYNFHIGFLKNRLSGVSVDSCKKWLSQNPVTVYYELASPVVTEIDLENFPLVYKDGHIFLNSEIAPMVEINYNVNQTQLIIGNGETLLRHEQEILDLDKLIVSFVDCEYRLRLLKFDMELSMMSL